MDVSSKKGVWVQIELKKLVSQWFRHPNENLGLAIHSYDNEGKELAVIMANDNEDNSLVSDLFGYPTLLEIMFSVPIHRFHSSKSESRRSRRTAGDGWLDSTVRRTPKKSVAVDIH